MGAAANPDANEPGGDRRTADGQYAGASLGLPADGVGSVASTGRRFLGLVVDALLSVGVAMLITQSAAPGIWSAVVLLAEYTLFTGLFLQTPGMRLMGIACVLVIEDHVHRDRPIGLPAAAVRAVLIQLVFPPLILDENGRGWHDRAARSVVVRTR